MSSFHAFRDPNLLWFGAVNKSFDSLQGDVVTLKTCGVVMICGFPELSDVGTSSSLTCFTCS